MLQKAYLLAKIGADTAENERNFAKNWQLPTGPLPVAVSRAAVRGRRRVPGADQSGLRRRRARAAGPVRSTYSNRFLSPHRGPPPRSVCDALSFSI